jgi:hypothetical protein
MTSVPTRNSPAGSAEQREAFHERARRCVTDSAWRMKGAPDHHPDQSAGGVVWSGVLGLGLTYEPVDAGLVVL